MERRKVVTDKRERQSERNRQTVRKEGRSRKRKTDKTERREGKREIITE